jgi:hypothetical protein
MAKKIRKELLISLPILVKLNADVGRTGTNLITMNRVAFLSYSARLHNLKIEHAVR